MSHIQGRFEELTVMAEKIEESQSLKEERRGSPQRRGGPQNYTIRTQIIDKSLLIELRTSVLSLLNRVFGLGSTTYQQFSGASEKANTSDQHGYFAQLKAIFLSVKSDFEGGYLFDVRNLVQASLFTDELDQAKHFLDAGYKIPAAVIAGTVLESTLRELCNQHSVSARPAKNSIA